MPHYQYIRQVATNPAAVLILLNELDEEGWEPISIAPSVLTKDIEIYLRREKQKQVVEGAPPNV